MFFRPIKELYRIRSSARILLCNKNDTPIFLYKYIFMFKWLYVFACYIIVKYKWMNVDLTYSREKKSIKDDQPSRKFAVGF